MKFAASEDELKDDSLWNYTLVNDGTIEQLSAVVRKVLVRMSLMASRGPADAPGDNKRVFAASECRSTRAIYRPTHMSLDTLIIRPSFLARR